MRLSLCILTLVGVTVLSLAPAAREPASAQEPAPFTIHFDKSLDFLVEFGSVTAVIGTTECGTLDFTASDWTLVVGGPGTPPACNEPWRVINLYVRGGPIQNAPTFFPGGSVTYEGLMPFPAIDGPGVPPFSINASPADLGITATELSELSSLSAYVNGARCGSASPEDLANDLLYIPIGATGTPDQCRLKGAEIALIYADGRRLAIRPSVGHGPYYTLTDLTLAAPGAGGAGSAGLAPPSDGSPALEVTLALVTLALLLLTRRFTTNK